MTILYVHNINAHTVKPKTFERYIHANILQFCQILLVSRYDLLLLLLEGGNLFFRHFILYSMIIYSCREVARGITVRVVKVENINGPGAIEKRVVQHTRAKPK